MGPLSRVTFKAIDMVSDGGEDWQAPECRMGLGQAALIDLTGRGYVYEGPSLYPSGLIQLSDA